MTAEIAVLNRSAVALAADSAVTIEAQNGRKIYNTVNKLFCLTKHHPVGIMIYGNAEINGVPWETIIKIYREKLGKKSFASIPDYCRDFIRFLRKDAAPMLTPGESRYVARVTVGYLEHIRERLEEELEAEQVRSGKQFTAKETMPVLSRILAAILKRHRAAKSAPEFRGASGPGMLRGYNQIVTLLLTEFFKNYPITPQQKRDLNEIVGLHLVKTIYDETALSGVVVAGFGDNTYFPRYCHHLIEGFIKGRPKFYTDENQGEISLSNNAVIRAFAQTNMAHAFMEGIDPGLLSRIKQGFRDLTKSIPESVEEELKKTGVKLKAKDRKALAEKIAEKISNLKDRVDFHRATYHVDPVIATTAILPKDELASMAEALVSLASFKKRVSMTPETVGGPIDVAVISKGDGFVWIKRKHYFNAELNPDFFNRNSILGGANE